MKATTPSLVMFGHHTRAHLLRLRFMLTHSANCCSLSNSCCMCFMLSVIIAMSSLSTIVLLMDLEVENWCPSLSYSSHRGNGSKNIMNM